MAVRIEFVLSIFIIAVLLFAYSFKIEQRDNNRTSSVKDLEFYDTNFTKVDRVKVLNRIESDYGVVSSKVLRVYGIKYRDEHIKEVVAKEAIIADNILYLNGEIKLYYQDGFSLFTQEAIYDVKSKVLNISGDFVAKRAYSSFCGRGLIYDGVSKVLRASDINATLYL
jgi:hypothetical protein